MSLHIYRAAGQPLIKEQRCPWIMRGFKVPAFKPNARVWARCCERHRLAKNCYVQHYYDESYVWCCDGKGCKSAAEKRRAKKLRAIAARAGWQTRRRLVSTHNIPEGQK